MIKKLTPEFGQELASIHADCLAGDFLPSLGLNFLTEVYNSALSLSGTFCLGYFNRGKLVGFVLGTKNMDLFFKQVFKKGFIKFLYIILPEVAKNPSLLKKIFETIFYTKKDLGPKAELIVIAVSYKFRSKGIGKKLIKNLEELFSKSGVKEYKLTVHANKAAVAFYERLLFKRLGKFNLYGKTWCIYEKQIK